VLLREVEAFNGVVIFATNLAANFDPAFERRIRTHVRFLMPGVEEREQIWQVQIHPRKTPLASGVNFRELAERFPSSGGEIKNAVLKAASAAAAEPGADSTKAIHQRHLVRAMEEVLAAKVVMKQSLFEDGRTQTEDPFIAALQAAERRWRSVALTSLGLAGGALVAAIVAVTIALMR
jgi:SpoVK/Ycf46/Vps4 family AAA+-type ATPase